MTDGEEEHRRGPDRRVDNRRDDPNVWSPQHKSQVDTMWGMVVGGGLILASIILLFWAVVNNRVELPILGACIFVMLMGLVAGKPKVFMPIFSAVLKKVPTFGKGTGNGSITRALPSIDPSTDDEE